MKRSFQRLLLVAAIPGLLPALVPPACGGAPPGLGFTCHGTVRFKAMFGETHWSGRVIMEHPAFRLEVDGDVHSFSGPRVGMEVGMGGQGTSRRQPTGHSEWISLVAVGEVRITFRPQAGEARHLVASRVVYLPREGRMLIDGVPHACADLDPADPAEDFQTPSGQ